MKSDNTYSFEDFNRLANREPNLEGNWIYRLTGIGRGTSPENDSDTTGPVFR